MQATNNSNVPATKILSREGQDRSKDILRAIFLHRELWGKNGYPKTTTLWKKWSQLLNHTLLQDYLQNNEGIIL